jgi:hypothetical protein
MTLCATIAGPRRWPLRELPLRLVFCYLVRREPRLLLNQVAPIGRSLAAPGASLLIRSERPAGLLYLFANDLWQTFLNNSGEIELELTRLDGSSPMPAPGACSKAAHAANPPPSPRRAAPPRPDQPPARRRGSASSHRMVAAVSASARLPRQR